MWYGMNENGNRYTDLYRKDCNGTVTPEVVVALDEYNRLRVLQVNEDQEDNGEMRLTWRWRKGIWKMKHENQKRRIEILLFQYCSGSAVCNIFLLACSCRNICTHSLLKWAEVDCDWKHNLHLLISFFKTYAFSSVARLRNSHLSAFGPRFVIHIHIYQFSCYPTNTIHCFHFVVFRYSLNISSAQPTYIPFE